MKERIALPTDSRWRRLPEERPGQILEAAVAVFAEHGISAAKLEDIAALAGVSKGTIYLYFSSKEELFREVVRLTVVPLIAQADEASAIRSLSAQPHLDGRYTIFGRVSGSYNTLARIVQGDVIRSIHRYGRVN